MSYSLADLLAGDDYGDDYGLLGASGETFAAHLAAMLDQVKAVKQNVQSLQAKRLEGNQQLSAKYAGKEVYVDSCPPGYTTCDNAEYCLDVEDKYASPLYDAAGSRCYLQDGVMAAEQRKLNELAKKARTRGRTPVDTRELEVSVQLLRDFVRLAGELSRGLNNIGKVNVGCDAVQAYFPGTDDASKKGRQAFCETLTKDDGARKCSYSSESNQCTPLA